MDLNKVLKGIGATPFSERSKAHMAYYFGRDYLAKSVLRLVDERCPENCKNIHDFATQEEMERFSRGYQRIAGFDKKSLNAKLSLNSV